MVFKYGMQRDFTAWLASLGERAPVKTLGELRAWNRAHEAAGTLKYGQAQLDISDEMDVQRDRERYRSRSRRRTSRSPAATASTPHLRPIRLDALVFPGSGGAAIAAKPGYPTVIVPFGMVPNTDAPARVRRPDRLPSVSASREPRAAKAVSSSWPMRSSRLHGAGSRLVWIDARRGA